MTDEISQLLPPIYMNILEATHASGFKMASEIKTCSLLRTLAASKPASMFLELGTGTGLATSWILDGMDDDSTLISIDNDARLLEIANNFLGTDRRLSLVTTDGADWVNANVKAKFDYIFADTWHGKFLLLDEVLSMLNKGGLYIIDDMLAVSSWPDGHQEKVDDLVKHLDGRDDVILTKQVWATGIIIGVKR